MYPTELARHVRGYDWLLRGKTGLEIGGPSPGMEPLGVYTSAARLDNLVFAETTLWASTRAGAPYEAPGKAAPGVVRIGDAVDMHDVRDGEYDFVFASHVLEHLVNPLRAMREIARVTRDVCILVLPLKDNTFDHRRPVTPFAELLQHLEDGRAEDDVSDHVDAIVRDYDLSRDPGAGTLEQFVERCKRHAENRALHVHVFDFALVCECMRFAGFEVFDMQLVAPFHQIVVGRKRSPQRSHTM